MLLIGILHYNPVSTSPSYPSCLSAELVQTEMHHVRTLRIMSEVYSKGLQKEVQLDTQLVERVFPMLDELLELHTHFFAHLLELKRKSSIEGRDDGSFLIRKIGDVLVSQVSMGETRGV